MRGLEKGNRSGEGRKIREEWGKRVNRRDDGETRGEGRKRG